MTEDDDTNTAKYFPLHFTRKGQNELKLKEKTSLEEEKIIIIDTEKVIEDPYDV